MMTQYEIEQRQKREAREREARERADIRTAGDKSQSRCASCGRRSCRMGLLQSPVCMGWKAER